MISDEKLIDLLLFHVNDKANHATTQKQVATEDNRQYWQGQYMAFAEMYSMLSNIKRTT
jgi:hypothetical protein